MQDIQTRRNIIKLTAAGVLSGGLTAEISHAGTGRNDAAELSPDQLRRQLVQCLGGPWPDPCPLRPQLRETIHKNGYRIESVTYEVEPGDRVAAYLLIPDGVDAENPAPAVAVWHQHAGQYELGKSEPAGFAGNSMHHTGVALAKQGYVTLCPDALCFEERRDPTGRLPGMKYERFEFLRYIVDGRCMAWKNILDMRRAVDFLCERPEVDADHLGCYGHSMGSTHTWLVGPHEPRLKALVSNCCLPTYSAIHDHHLLHCFPNFVPGWFRYGDTPEIASLIAPRALHLNLGENDTGSPIEHAREGIRRISQVYADQDASAQFSSYIETGAGHVLSEAMWQQVRRWFAQHLDG
ncbi:MAG: dienelactone hydrolase family protein [Fuerstiella sp.]|nr:dienelactone hydrolase family protein [Fuerstiella sp.]